MRDACGVGDQVKEAPVDEHGGHQPPPLAVGRAWSDAAAPVQQEFFALEAAAPNEHEDVECDVQEEDRRRDERPSSSAAERGVELVASGRARDEPPPGAACPFNRLERLVHELDPLLGRELANVQPQYDADKQ